MADWKTILTTTDFSERAEVGVRAAADLATRLDSKLLLLYVVEDRMPPVLDQATRRRALAEHKKVSAASLDKFAKTVLGELSPEQLVEVGRPHEVIVEIARWRDVDLIVLGTHGFGLVGQAFLGSTTERVIHRAPCPVMAVRSL